MHLITTINYYHRMLYMNHLHHCIQQECDGKQITLLYELSRWACISLSRSLFWNRIELWKSSSWLRHFLDNIPPCLLSFGFSFFFIVRFVCSSCVDIIIIVAVIIRTYYLLPHAINRIYVWTSWSTYKRNLLLSVWRLMRIAVWVGKHICKHTSNASWRIKENATTPPKKNAPNNMDNFILENCLCLRARKRDDEIYSWLFSYFHMGYWMMLGFFGVSCP